MKNMGTTTNIPLLVMVDLSILKTFMTEIFILSLKDIIKIPTLSNNRAFNVSSNHSNNLGSAMVILRTDFKDLNSSLATLIQETMIIITIKGLKVD